ncbi:MAG TPA: TIGR03118 family protein [Thermoplasmata archaeon]|nr:TIGR03118 family protein [Thermoplasmata archaeon]
MSVIAFTLAVVALFATPVSAAAVPGTYTVTALVSNNGVPGTTVDARLQNAWGLVAGPGTPWWVSDNGADFSTLYNATGVKRNLNVSVDGAPTGIVFNGDSTSFRVGPNNAGALFIFATEGGTIAGWHPSLGTASQVKVDSSERGAVYKGLAIASVATGPQLYATDFHNARIDVFNATWAAAQTSGGFVDPKIPAGYAPFGIQTIGTRIFVTFAKQGPGAKDELDGQGLGFVDAFDTDGNLLARVAQRGQLNAPWGLALAPASFGRFGGDLLVGNFGDGHVNAYQELPDGTFALIGALRTTDGRKLAIDGLWALQFGHGTVNNGPIDTLFFTAGPNDESDGLFGTITVA